MTSEKKHCTAKFINGILLLLLFMVISSNVQSQNKEEINFEKGHVIQIGPFLKYPRYARSEYSNDPVISSLLAGSFVSPTNKKQKSSLAWEIISPDDKGYFNSEKFNTGGLYLEYDSPKSQIMIFDGAGNSKAIINGVPRSGDHFDFKFTKHPVQLKKGINTFYLTGGRYSRIKASLYKPASTVLLSTDHNTLPDLVFEEDGFKWGSVMVTNATNKAILNYVIESIIDGNKSIKTAVPTIEKLTSRLVPYKLSELRDNKNEKINVQVKLFSSSKKQLSTIEFEIKNKPFSASHDRTFISSIDNSVQYYSVTPGVIPNNISPSLFFSLHGAGVQARNQAGSYKPKDWGHLISPTNRGPFGFAWEDWGRLDALEVLEIGKELFKPDPQKIYLTGHSMGGHASWYLGATYPDYWAAIAPCAGYPELHGWIKNPRPENESDVQLMYARAGNVKRTKLLAKNYLHNGIYVNHGDADPVVSVEHAREMRKILGDFHPDFTYYEYPEGSHWYGNNSVDWPPLFDYLKIHTIPKTQEVNAIEFHTANPGVSSSSNWVTLYQQIHPFQLSNVNFTIEKDKSSLSGTTQNVSVLNLNFNKAGVKFPFVLDIDGTKIKLERSQSEIWLKKNGDWKVSAKPNSEEKGPHRSGDFKDAFRNNVVFVYGTKGNKQENSWNYNKARYDAETFSYRGNGSIEIVSDRKFDLDHYKDRNVIIYGNSDTNSTWKLLLNNSPVQVSNGEIKIGHKTLTGDNLGTYFIQARPDSQTASVGVIAGSGLKGFKAAYANHYFISGTSFPDLTVFRSAIVNKGFDAIECTGFFGNDWSVENGDFTWK